MDCIRKINVYEWLYVLHAICEKQNVFISLPNIHVETCVQLLFRHILYYCGIWFSPTCYIRTDFERAIRSAVQFVLPTAQIENAVCILIGPKSTKENTVSWFEKSLSMML